MKKIALTGNIGCGKSYVLQHLAKQGVFVLDCDALAKQVREEHCDEISKMFSVDAKDVKALAKVIFSSDEKREQLECFLYPLILDKLQELFQQYQNETCIVVEVPLLFEKGWNVYFDEVWVVSVREEVALQRLKQYRNMNKEEAKERLAKQMDLSIKEQMSDVVIYNNEEDDVILQLQHLLKKEGIVC